MRSKILRYTSSFIRPSDATAYTVGDEISSHATAGSVVLPTFDMGGYTNVRILRAAMGVVPSAANVVITAMDISMHLFKTTDAPAAVGDNVALAITSAKRLVAPKFSFVNGAWTQPTGALTAGASAFQEVLSDIGTMGNVIVFNPPETNTLTAVLQADATWTPLAQTNTFTLHLDIEVPF